MNGVHNRNQLSVRLRLYANRIHTVNSVESVSSVYCVMLCVLQASECEWCCICAQLNVNCARDAVVSC
jgi:hypothetical protein